MIDIFWFIPEAVKNYNYIKRVENEKNTIVLYLLDKDKKIKWMDLEYITFGHHVSFDIEDSDSFKDVLNSALIKGEDIKLIIDCSGGDAVDCDCMVKYIEMYREHGGKITAIVPRRAFSAACMLAFACDSIYMDNMSCLSPVDPIIYDNDNTAVSVAAMMKSHEDVGTISQPSLTEYGKHIDDIKMVKETCKYMTKNINRFYVDDINKKNKNSKQEQIEKIVNMFVSGDKPHHTPFSMKDLIEMNLKIDKIDYNVHDKKLIKFYNTVYRLIKLSF